MLSIQCYTWISELGDPSIVICIVIVNAISLIQRQFDRSSRRRFSIKKLFLQISQNSQENNCARASSLETLLQIFSCEFSEIYRTTLFTKHLWATASAFRTMSNIYDRTFLWKVVHCFRKRTIIYV